MLEFRDCLWEPKEYVMSRLCKPEARSRIPCNPCKSLESSNLPTWKMAALKLAALGWVFRVGGFHGLSAVVCLWVSITSFST